MPSDKVVPISEGKRRLSESLSVQRKPRHHRQCAHHRAYVHEIGTGLECRDCGQPLDPLRWLLSLAREEEQRRLDVTRLTCDQAQLQADIRVLDREAKRLAREVDALIAWEDSLRGQICDLQNRRDDLLQGRS